ncbi:hypothetical protein BDF21DRAFT_400941 [Thamnidium elegans]|nr:hypothetical protein BDF21DRAFT_400941 [Thamnidium elegans]
MSISIVYYKGRWCWSWSPLLALVSGPGLCFSSSGGSPIPRLERSRRLLRVVKAKSIHDRDLHAAILGKRSLLRTLLIVIFSGVVDVASAMDVDDEFGKDLNFTGSNEKE